LEVRDRDYQIITNTRLRYALVLSLFVHALILSLHFGVFGVGLPNLAMPWKEKRVQAPIAPAPIIVLSPAIPVQLQNPKPIQVPNTAPPPPSISKSRISKAPHGLQVVELIAPRKIERNVEDKNKDVRPKKINSTKITAQKKAAVLNRPEKSKRILAQELTNNDDFRVRTSDDEENEQARIKAEQEAIAEKELLIKKEVELEEERLAEQKLAEQKLAEQKLAEQKLAEQKLAEQKLAEQKLAEQKLAEQKLAEQKLAEQKLAEQKLAEQKLAEQKLAEQKLVEQKLAEQKLAEQKLAERKLVEQKLAEQKLAEQKLAEQKLAEQKLAEQKLAEQKLAEQKLVEQKLAEQKLAEQKLAEQKLAEQNLAQAQAQAKAQAGVGLPTTGNAVAVPKQSSPQVDMMQRFKEQARQIAKENPANLREASNRRRSFLGSFDKEVPLRMYVDAWKQKIERNGNFNYSQKAKDQARSEPLVTIAIRSDGSVEDVVFHRSSGRADIDEAVRRIIRVNAPYAVFPPNLAAKYDVLEIKRVWSFQDVLRILEELP
jgi:hypothetical protein